MQTAKDALSAMGLNLDDVLEMDSALRTRPSVRDGRICICGHGVSKHTVYPNGKVLCKPSKMQCPCKNVRAVIDAEDTRPFLRRTVGAGSMHAFTRGLAVLAASGKEAHWIIDLVCDDCGEFDNNIQPVPVTADGRVSSSTDATGYDKFLCPSCRVPRNEG